MQKTLEITCLNCTQFCQNRNNDKLIKHLEELKKEGDYEHVTTNCTVLKSSLKSIGTTMGVV